jgi:diguanylate cyclase (GGDEF)-like protein
VTEQHRFRRKDGSLLWVETKVRQLKGSTGEVIELQGSIRDITERKRVEERLEYLAAHDPLTDLINRRRLQEELATTVAYTLRYDTPAALLVLDLDHFKFVNDTLGHAAGDALLIRLARMLERRMRETDVLGRLGGDEFALILRNVDRSEAEVVAAGMRELVRSCRAPEGTARPPRLSASVGIALIEPEVDLDAEGLLAEADIAMYEAKEAGRDRAFVADLTRERPPKFMARIGWADRIRSALEDDGFALMAQPIVNRSGPSEERHELLLRMRDVDGRLIEPGAFLYIAERFGLIQDIDRWVVGQAVEILEQAGDRELKLHVNLSGASVESEEMLEFVRRSVAEADIDPGDLTFEVTETAAIVNVDQARGFAEALADLGCSLALDDFGSGFGSLYYLKRLPFDFLKIDGDFVRQLTWSSADQVTVSAVIEIAAGLGKQTIAEWVEDEETKQLLISLSIDYVQGFHLGAPKPATGLVSPTMRLLD